MFRKIMTDETFGYTGSKALTSFPKLKKKVILGGKRFLYIKVENNLHTEISCIEGFVQKCKKKFNKNCSKQLWEGRWFVQPTFSTYD